jgi:uncharacterized protein YjbJ (UPF0337 family)
MTSWTRGHENEEEGERKMNDRDAGDKVAGAAQKAAGEVEQGADNVRDYATGKQRDLKGEERTTRDNTWAQDTTTDDG